MRAGIVQFCPIFGQIDANIERATHMIRNIDADLVILPELFNTGYVFLESDNMDDFAEPPDGKTISTMTTLSAQTGKAIVGGFSEKAGNACFNSQFLVTPDGDLNIYRKIHLFDREKLFFQPGDLLPRPFEWQGVRIGQLICFDWIFPEIYRSYALQGTDLICHSTNLVLPFAQRASFARAVENRMYIAVSNRTGRETRGDHSLYFTGQSIAYSPKGEMLLQAAETGDFAGTFYVDTELSQDKNITERNHLLNDRRPEMYGL